MSTESRPPHDRDTNDLGHLVRLPSLGAVTYQAEYLVRELTGITDEAFPAQACRVRDVFLCIAETSVHELRALRDPEDPLGIRDAGVHTERVRVLARALRTIYEYLRFLRASSPHRVPLLFKTR